MSTILYNLNDLSCLSEYSQGRFDDNIHIHIYYGSELPHNSDYKIQNLKNASFNSTSKTNCILNIVYKLDCFAGILLKKI